MHTVGVRELKARLSHHLRRVQSGSRLLITERGRVIATINPAATGEGFEWIDTLVRDGRAQWGGGKPAGCRQAVSTTGGPTVSSAVLEDRR